MKIKIPSSQSLLPYQRQGVEAIDYFMRESKGCYLADEPGLGKTIQTIAFINNQGYSNIIIICPAIMRLTWEKELKSWLVSEKNHRVLVALSGKDVREFILKNPPFDFPTIFIVSYDLSVENYVSDYIKRFKWDCMVLDEAHALKNVRAKRTKVILKDLWDTANHHICLSGTPMTQSVVDCYPTFKRLAPTAIPSFNEFVKMYVYSTNTPWGIKYYGIKNAEELSALIRKHFFIRRKKEEVLGDLPSKIYTEIVLPERGSVVKEKEDLLAKELKLFLADIRRNRQISSMQYDNLATELRVLGESKVTAVTEFVNQLLEQELPVVIFAWHKATISLFKSIYTDAVVITGDTPMDKREEYIQAFQSKKVKVFIGQMAACGVGITLTASCNCVLAELSWSPAVMAQAVDRLHRIGQKSVVNVYYFIVQRSIEEKVWQIVINKIKTFNKVID